MLNVLSLRLGRIVDRARVLESRLVMEKHQSHRDRLQLETEALWQRIRLVNWSLRTFVAGALLICMVIMTLFLSELLSLDFATVIASLFIGAMNLMILGLVLFLIEVSISTQRIREGISQILDEDGKSSQ